MSCEDLSSYFVDYVNGDLAPDETEKVRLHLRSCAACRAEIEGLGAVWHALGDLADEEPSDAVRERFYALLDGHQRSEAEAKTWKSLMRWARWWPERPALQMAAAAAALVLGLAAGAGLTRGGSGGELAELRAEMASLHRLVSLSLLSQESASTRLRGVSYSRRTAGDDEVVAALVDVVDGDENVGVRLAAIDVLARFADRGEVADKLRASLLGQSSPLVQLALIDLLVDLDGPETARTLRELAAHRDLEEAVRGRIADGLGPHV